MIKNFKHNFKKSRLSSHKSQSEFASFLGISKSSVRMYENGNRIPPIKIIEEMSIKLNMNLLDEPKTKEK